MRPPPILLAALLVLLSACGGEVAGGRVDGRQAIAGTESGGGGTSASATPNPTVRIDIGDAEPLSAPDDPIVSTVPVTVVDEGSEPGAEPSVPSEPEDGAADALSTTVQAGAETTGDVATAPVASRSSVVAQAVVPRVTARVEPQDDATAVTALDHPTAVGSPLVFLVVDGASVAGWLEVQLPIQPNGTTGWVRREDVTLFENPYRLEIDRSQHRLQVFHLGQPWLETTIAVGTGATPTPVGAFYLLELLAPPDPTGPYGPYAFGLSGFSEVLDGFGGADTAIIGLHGTDQPDALGTDVSFGCVRIANDVMERLATTLPLGTPVQIT